MKKKISLAEAKEGVKRHLTNVKTKNAEIKLPNTVDFDLSTIQEILKNPDCKGIRAHFVQDESNQVSLLLAGYCAEGKNLLPQKQTEEKTNKLSASSELEDGFTLSMLDTPVRLCPPSCTIDEPTTLS